jgi:hypothetical protein
VPQDVMTLAELQASRSASRGDEADQTNLAVSLSRLARFAGAVEGWHLAVSSIAGIAAAICFAIWWPDREQSFGFWYAGIALLAILLLALYSHQTIWHRLCRGPVFGWRPEILDDPALAPAYRLMEQCVRGEIAVETYLGERIDTGFFRNALAPLLLSDSATERLRVRSEFRRKGYEAQLRASVVDGAYDESKLSMPRHSSVITGMRQPALPTATEIGLGLSTTERIGEDEPPLKNDNPEIQWLVGGTRGQFGLGLDRYLDTIAPSKVAWHRVVLEIGRRELRKGGGHGSQADAIRQIIFALKAAGLKYPDVDRGDATSSIKQLLSGRSGTKDITRHFRRETGENPQDGSSPSDKNG